MNYLLHIDTSGELGVVMISRDGVVLAKAENTESRNQAQTLSLLIEQVLQQCSLRMNELSGIAVCAGPGSYTGLRIGMATAKGICYALNLPLYLHNRLTLLAWQAMHENPGGNHVIAVLTARAGESFAAVYDQNFNEIEAPKHLLDAEIIEMIKKFAHSTVISDKTRDFDFFANMASNQLISDAKIDAENWAKFALNPIFANEPANLFGAEPFYLKDVYTHK